ncbi:PAS domain-containing protein [Mesorhizobium sp.]|uniref:PAS domain-containing protein n=1 Tax=Mesorhizobium sp. TaxID=1871066 RepID=UPI00257B5A73|nr:PAS domain-containing protein [Mesorhizobium sp.]
MEIDLGRVFDTLPAMVWTAQPDGHFDFANRRWSDYTGLSLDEAHGWEWQAAVNPDDLPTVLERWRAILASGGPGEMEARIRRFDGKYRWINIECSPMCDDVGGILKWCGVGTDVDDRRRAEEALSIRGRYASSIVDSIPGLVAAFTPGGEVEFVNRQVLEYFGRKLEELKRWERSDATHPDDLPRAVELFTQSIASGEPFEFEVRARRFDGVYRWFQSRGFPLRDRNGRIVRWYNLLIDIDERKRAEEALAARERNLNEIINTIPVLAWSARPDGSTEFFNQHYLHYAGLSIGQSKDWVPTTALSDYWDLTAAVHPEDVDGLTAAWEAILASGKSGEAEARLRRFDGTYRWFLVRANPLCDESGNIVKWYGVSIDIDDRKRAEEALRASETNLRLIIDSIPGLICTMSAVGRVELLSRQLLDYFGKSPGELKDWQFTDAVHPDDLPRVLTAFTHSVKSGDPYDIEHRCRRADGVYRWFQVRALSVRGADGRITCWYVVLVDIDDRKRAEEALRISESNLKLLINTLPDLVWSTRPDGSVEFVNQHFLDYVGLSFEEVCSLGWTVAFHPDDLSRLAGEWATIVAAGKAASSEGRLRRFDGEYRWFLLRANPLHDEKGNVVRWYGVNTDIDDRRRAETNLAREKHLLEMIASGSPLRDVLSALCTMVEEAAFGCYCDVHPIDWSGPTIEYSVAPSLPATYTDPIAGLSLNGDALPCAIAVRQKVQVVAEDMDTDPRWLESSVRTHVLEHGLRSVWSTPIYAKDGRVLGTLCLYQRQPANPSPQHQSLIAHATHLASIAIERSRTEAALRRSETLLAEGQQLSSTGSFSWRVDTDEVAFSEELCRIFEFDPSATVTLEQVRARVHPEDIPLLSTQMARVRAGHNYIGYEIRLMMPDGRVKYLRTVGRVVRHPGSRLECLVSVQDVTQRRLADEALNKARSELAHVARVTSLGALTASIAHEVNQPLSGIITNASTCLRMLAANPPNIDVAQETARRTIRDGNRAADVIARLRALFSKRTPRIEPIDLNEAAREVVALFLGDLQRSRVILHNELADGLPLVGGDRIQLQQVIMNLLRNGADAMSGVDDRPRRLVIRTELDGDNHVRLSVQDTGIGLGPDGTERLFEAFYTTKNDGMGIGLSVSRSIIEQHHGRLWAVSNDGPGATFSFSIPEYFKEENPVHEAGVLQAPVASSSESSAGIT